NVKLQGWIYPVCGQVGSECFYLFKAAGCGEGANGVLLHGEGSFARETALDFHYGLVPVDPGEKIEGGRFYLVHCVIEGGTHDRGEVGRLLRGEESQGGRAQRGGSVFVLKNNDQRL